MVGGGGSRLLSLLPKAEYDGFERRERGNNGGKTEEEEVDQRRRCCCLPFGTWSQLSLSLFLRQPRSFVCFDRIGGGGGGSSAGQGIYHQSRLIVADFCASVSSYLEIYLIVLLDIRIRCLVPGLICSIKSFLLVAASSPSLCQMRMS